VDDAFVEGFVRNAGKWTVVAFLNSGSGGGMGKKILDDMVKLLGEDYVFDLRNCKRGNMPEDKLLPMAKDPLVKVLACGGDGTMGWILSSIDRVWNTILGPKVGRAKDGWNEAAAKAPYHPLATNNLPLVVSLLAQVQLENTKYRGHLPLAMMPLGTGNDLSRSFKWGSTFSNSMRKPGMIKKVEQAVPVPLDRWRCVVVPFRSLTKEAKDWVPAMLGEKMRNREASIHHLKTVFDDDGEVVDVEDVDLEDANKGANSPKGAGDASVNSSQFSVSDEQPNTQR